MAGAIPFLPHTTTDSDARRRTRERSIVTLRAKGVQTAVGAYGGTLPYV